MYLPAPAQQTATSALTPEVRQRIERQVRQYAAAPPEAEVTLGTPHAGDISGYDDLPVVIRDGQTTRSVSFLLSRDRKRLLYVTTFDLTEDPYARVMRSIDLSGRPWRGAANAPVTLVMYDDFECPFCARMYITLFNQVMNRYRDRVRVVMKDFPMSELHPWARDAAVAANCLNAAKPEAYWLYSDYVHTHQQAATAEWNAGHDAFARLAEKYMQQAGGDAAQLRACIAKHDVRAIEKSLAEGHALGVSATPGISINGEFFEGELSADQLRMALDKALAESAQK